MIGFNTVTAELMLETERYLLGHLECDAKKRVVAT